MSDKKQFRLVSPSVREAACKAIREASEGYVVTVAEPTRNTAQNAKLWAMLTDVSRQVIWFGQKYNQEDWKTMFTRLLRQELRIAPSLGEDGGVTVLGQSTSKMSVGEFAELIELIYAFGATLDPAVIWSEPRESMHHETRKQG